MKLPVFHTSDKFTSLFKALNTQYSIIDMSKWHSLGDTVFADILSNGEALIEVDQLSEYLDKDGFFRVNNKTILIYIKNQYIKYWDENKGASGYRYHLYNCKTIRSFIENGKKARYVFRDPVYKGDKGDEVFEINLTELGSQQTVKTIRGELKVCLNCLKESNFEGYKTYNYYNKQDLQKNFNYKTFFKLHEAQRLAKMNFKDYRTAQKNIYSKNFSELSKKFRKSKNWKCEKCKIDLSEYENRRYLHTHHINSLKQDNSLFNLRALCIECHAEMPDHHFIKSNPDYKYFLRKKQLLKKFRE